LLGVSFFCLLLLFSAEAKRPKVSKDSVLIKSPARILLGKKEMVISRDTMLYLPDSVELVILRKNKKIKRIIKNNNIIIRHLNAWVFAGKPDTSQVNIGRQEYLSVFSGKIVRKITIQNVNVFGATVSYSKPNEELTLVEKTGNRIHRNTREKTIRNSLNIREGQVIAPYELSEKEVIIRNLPYISDVMITPKEVPNTDSVDLNVAVQDIWSIGFHWEPYAASKGFFEVYDENTFGYGHEAVIRTRYNNQRSPAAGYEAYYTINNIGNEIVRIKAGFANYFDLKNLILDVQKDYYFKSNYAYGLTLQKYQNLVQFPLHKTGSYVKEFHNDIWAGKALPLYPRHQFDINRPQLYVAARITNNRFCGDRYVSLTDNPLYQDQTAFLGSIAIAKQWYTQTKLLLGYGRTEDIPSGYKFELVGGIEKGEFRNRPYFALKASQGGLVDGIGYFRGYAELGGYVKNDSIQQGTFRAGIFYYSSIFKAGLYRFRQFLSLDYTHGFNRFRGLEESLYLDNYNGIRGYVGDSIRAQRRLSLHLETIAYSPYALWNFKMAFFAYSDLVWMNVYGNNPFKGPIYSGIGIGVRIRNENLAFKTFSIRLGFYPRVPYGGTVDYFNISGSDRLRLSGFKPTKPDFVQYQNQQ
jgi:Outer membrane protein/protective antigen OMA87